MPKGQWKRRIPDGLAAFWLPPYAEPDAPPLTGGELHSWLHKTGITHPQLAAHMGVSVKTVGQWVYDKKDEQLSPEVRQRLHAAMTRIAAWQSRWAVVDTPDEGESL